MAIPDPPKPQPPKPIQGNQAISAEISAIDADLAKLKIRFEQYFLGLERRPPTDELDRIRRRVQQLKLCYTKNTALKFRTETLYQKFKSYEQLWLKTLKEIEEGTYRKDLMRLRLKNLRKAKASAPVQPSPASPAPEAQDAAEQPSSAAEPNAAGAAVKEPAQVPPPLAASPARPKTVPGSQRPASALSEARIDEIFCDYIIAKQQCRESTAGITREALARSLQAKAGGRDVKVVIKNGKAMLALVK